jgi:signal transduction histidine kinase
MTNALKFTDSGHVTLAAKAFDGALQISVQDSGVGIPSGALEYIFEPFRQGDGSSTRQHDGVGLGLYIVRRLLQILGGSIEVESQVGVGSTFRVRLPLHGMARLAA